MDISNEESNKKIGIKRLVCWRIILVCERKSNNIRISTKCETTQLETRCTMHLILDGGSADDVDEVVVVGVRGPLGGEGE